ncbi:peptide MFS transporter [Methylocystis sp. MJC1]|jgi:POT family proton-dependent oligopeptide transporter|nr:peptide MFS transporter [Methylocystis sp. MJC1]UZX13336.1 peptide MFS transporter [Methylocystis sp. MJC1]
MWERFSYYGMRALLVLYMVDYLLAPERAREALGLAELRRGLELLSGPLAPQPFASQVYGLYTGLVYLTPILGGLIADRLLGRTRTIALGAGMMLMGHFMMAYEPFFLIALLLIAFGCGAFKPNISTQVGELYAENDLRRDRTYSVFYVGINIGAFFAPLVCGTLGEKIGWHYGFACAGVGMGVGLATYLLGLSHLPPDPPLGSWRAVAEDRENLRLRQALLLVLLFFIPSSLFWAAFEQQGNTIALWVERSTDRHIDLLVWRGDIPVTWFQALNPLMIFLFTPPLVALWGRLARRGREPSTLRKLSIGCLGVAVSYGVMALAAWSGGGEKTSWLWLLAYFAIITIFELHFSPITLSLASRLAPVGVRSALMGLWLASMFLGNLLAGWLGGF